MKKWSTFEDLQICLAYPRHQNLRRYVPHQQQSLTRRFMTIQPLLDTPYLLALVWALSRHDPQSPLRHMPAYSRTRPSSDR